MFGLLAFAVTLGTGWMATAVLPSDVLGKSATTQLLTESSMLWQILFIVFIGPPFETLIAQWFPLELLRRWHCGVAVSIGLSSAVFGIGHYVNGGFGHGITAAAAGAVFAYAYLFRRNEGAGRAFSTAALAHMMNNTLALTAFALGAA
jgi:membrane protease YdiL (CAAX protease family)